MRQIWLLIVIVTAALLGARPLAAQSSAAISGDSTAAYRFGQVMEFRLDLTGEHQITAVTLFIAASDLPQTVAIDLEFDPARELTVVHQLDLTQLRLAPFSQITYWWAAVDRRDNEWRSPEQALEYADDQFDWRQLERGGVTVHWTGNDLALGQTALDVVAEALPRIRDIIPAVEDEPIRIYIYPSLADLRAALRLTGRDWIGAHAQPDLGVILVVAANPRTAGVDLRHAIPHELTHLLLYQATGIHYTAVPRWFDEGLATFFETEPNPIYTQLTTAAVENGTTIPFANLCRHFPEQEAQAALAYAQSGSLIRFIEAEYGRQTLRDMIAAFNDGADCQTAVNRVLSVSLNELERQWLRSRQPQSDLTRFFQQNGLILLLLLGGFGLTGLLLRPPVRK
jgi:hypothetical protein